ncbi:MAG: hypothetical protein AB8B53_03250 [Flavobacteriales bacterium]
MKPVLACMIVVFFMFSCKKEKEVFENNTIPEYTGISTLSVENYVNRLFIDLLGREPLDTEMSAEVSALESASLSLSSREFLVSKLQTDSDSLPGDSSYFKAYNRKFYEDTKARILEGISDGNLMDEYNLRRNIAINDSLNGNLVAYELNWAAAQRILAVINSQYQYREGLISVEGMYASMILSDIYDQINMNTFNFINACFDDLYYRFPTQAEFDASFPIIENNEPGQILGEVAQNKDEYITILVQDTEFREGLVRWVFQSLLAREPNSSESFESINDLAAGENAAHIQKSILITDEYAGF